MDGGTYYPVPMKIEGIRKAIGDLRWLADEIQRAITDIRVSDELVVILQSLREQVHTLFWDLIYKNTPLDDWMSLNLDINQCIIEVIP